MKEKKPELKVLLQKKKYEGVSVVHYPLRHNLLLVLRFNNIMKNFLTTSIVFHCLFLNLLRKL